MDDWNNGNHQHKQGSSEGMGEAAQHQNGLRRRAKKTVRRGGPGGGGKVGRQSEQGTKKRMFSETKPQTA